MGQQTGPTDINLAGWDTPYTVNLPNGTTQAGVFHTTHAPTQDEINQFIADTEARLNMAATDQAKAAAKAEALVEKEIAGGPKAPRRGRR